MMKHLTVTPENFEESQVRLALDMDSTLADSEALVYELMDTDHTPEDQESWEWPHEQFGADQFLGAFAEAWADNWYRIEPTEESTHLRWAVEALNQWYKVDIVTSQPDDPAVSAGKKAWLEYHEIPYDEFVTVPPSRTKANLGYTVYVDDKPALPARVNGSGAKVYLVDRCYNEDADGHYDRVRTVSDVAREEYKLTGETEVMGPTP